MPLLSALVPHLSTSSLLLTVSALSLAYWLINTFYIALFSPLSRFPGPRLNAFSKWPFIRQVWAGREAAYVTALHDEFGPVVRLGPQELSFNDGPKAQQAIYGFSKAAGDCQKDPKFYTKHFNGVDSMFNADNAGHSRQRRIFSYSFSDRALREQLPLIRRWTSLLEEKLVERAETKTPTDMVTMWNCATFDIMGDLTFSENLQMLHHCEVSDWVKSIFGTMHLAVRVRMICNFAVGRFLVNRIIRQVPSLHEQEVKLWRYTSDRVDGRLEREPTHPDFMSKTVKKDGIEGPGLFPGEHHSNAQLFIVAGSETTATALSGVTYHLLRNPNYLSKLTSELRNTFESSDDLTIDSLNKLPYLNAVLHEGLRHYPPVATGLPRVTPAYGAKIADHEIPGGTTVSTPMYATFHSAAHFAEPKAFRPERWLGTDPKFAQDNLAAVEPFSVGPRNCLGKNLAWLELRLLLATVMLNFDLEFVQGGEGEKGTWGQQRTFTVWEKRPLMVTLKKAVRT